MKRILATLSPYIFSAKQYNYMKASAAIAIDLANTAINIIPPILLAEHIRSDSESNGISQNLLILAFGVGFVANQSLPKLKNMLINSVRANVQKELSLAMVEKSFGLELDYHLTTRTGEFSQALTKNYSTIDKLIPSFFGEVLPQSLQALATSGVLFYYHKSLGAVEFIALLTYIGMSTYLERKAIKVREECVRASYKAYGTLIESISNYQVGHQFGNIPHEIKTVDRALIQSEKMYRLNHHTDDRTALILSLINVGGTISTVLCAILLNRFSAADMAVVGYLALQFSLSLDTLGPAISTLYTALIDSERIVNFLHRTSSVADQEDAPDLNLEEAPDLIFRNVSFAYNQKQILDDISFTVKAGQKVAIVGSTGSGKSTLIKLLLRFYRPQNGSISINGMDIQNITAESLRKHIAVVAQDSMLFNDSIANNIRYGYLEATDADVQKAARAAGLRITAEDKEKGGEAPSLNSLSLESSAGEKGGKLSGGEKQRVCIARALLKGGVIYLLDEATASLDPETEAAVQNTLDQITHNATTLIITHRLNTIVNADQIIYLDKGKIAEHGTFQELMDRNGLFAQQFTTQCRELGVDPSTFREAKKTSPALLAHDPVPNFWKERRLQRLEHKEIESEPESISMSKTESLLTPLLGSPSSARPQYRRVEPKEGDDRVSSLYISIN